MGAGRGVFGPYKEGNRYRLRIRTESGDPGHVESYGTREEAEADKKLWQEELAATASRSVKEAIEEYEEYLRDTKKNKATSYVETPRRLRWILCEVIDEAIEVVVNTRRCERLYDRIKNGTYEKGGETRAYSVDYCKNTLAETKTFVNWCIKKKWIKENGFAGVEDERQRNHGKPQHTDDEARAFNELAFAMAERGDHGAVAALMAQTMGVRAQEITKRVVRDVDANGTVLLIQRTGKGARAWSAKTKAGERKIRIPGTLQPFIVALTKDKAPDDLLFPSETIDEETQRPKPHWRDWPTENIKRICKEAGIPEYGSHSLRGKLASIGVAEGIPDAALARYFGHTSSKMTVESGAYATPDATLAGKQKALQEAMGKAKRTPAPRN